MNTCSHSAVTCAIGEWRHFLCLDIHGFVQRRYRGFLPSTNHLLNASETKRDILFGSLPSYFFVAIQLWIHSLHTDQNRQYLYLENETHFPNLWSYLLFIFKSPLFSCRVSEDTALFMLKEIYRDKLQDWNRLFESSRPRNQEIIKHVLA